MKQNDNREMIELDITDEEFLHIAKAAHLLDITFNEFIEKAVREVITTIEAEKAAFLKEE